MLVWSKMRIALLGAVTAGALGLASATAWAAPLSAHHTPAPRSVPWLPIVVRVTARAIHERPQAVWQAWRDGATLARIAAQHGVSAGALTKDVEQALDTRIQRLRDSGHLSAQRAATLEAQVAKQVPLWLGRPFPKGAAPWRFAFRPFMRGRRWLPRAAAPFLHMTPSAVQQALRRGESLATLARSHGTTGAALAAHLTAWLDARLHRLASRHQLPARQVQALRVELRKWVWHLVNRTGPARPARHAA